MIRIELLIMVLMALFGCGRLRTDPKGDLHRRHGSANRDDGCKTVDVRAMDFQARVSHVVITSDAGGYATDNRFRCEVDASSDCELWLEVRDANSGVRFSEIKDARTRRFMSVGSSNSNLVYDVEVVIDGEGESVQSCVSLWCKPAIANEAFVVVQTNAVFGTWKGR